jgi:5-formyltetrahydrofolate cyclo-ligase
VTKAECREEARRRLASILPQREEKSRELIRRLVETEIFRTAKTVALFAPIAGEPFIESVWENAARQQFCYPRVFGSELQLLRVGSREEVAEKSWHPQVREPAFSSERIVSLEEVDLLLVPGLAFTPEGHRLGRGGGFYDRLLALRGPKTRTFGVCFDAQMFPQLPLESHDESVDAVLTESGVLPAEPR